MADWSDPKTLAEAELWLECLTTKEEALLAIDHLLRFPDREANRMLADAESLASRSLLYWGRRGLVFQSPDEDERVRTELKILPLRPLAVLRGVQFLQKAQGVLAEAARLDMNLRIEAFQDLTAWVRFSEATGKFEERDFFDLAASFQSRAEV